VSMTRTWSISPSWARGGRILLERRKSMGACGRSPDDTFCSSGLAVPAPVGIVPGRWIEALQDPAPCCFLACLSTVHRGQGTGDRCRFALSPSERAGRLRKRRGTLADPADLAAARWRAPPRPVSGQAAISRPESIGRIHSPGSLGRVPNRAAWNRAPRGSLPM